VDAFCPECDANVGPGTLDSVGCPLCGYSDREKRGDDERLQAVLRISRHEETDSHIRALQQVFGADVEVITNDLVYGDDPVGIVAELIEKLGSFDFDTNTTYEVIAVEAAGPELVLQALVEGLEVPIIRPVFRREENGRVAVVGKDANGRDIFDVERYEQLVVEMRPSLVGKSL